MMIPPPCERGKWVSLTDVVATLLPVGIDGESEVVDDSSSCVWGEQDETDVDVKPLEVILAWVVSDLNSSDEHILDFVPCSDFIQEPVKFSASFSECAVSISKVDSDIPLTILLSPFSGKPFSSRSLLCTYTR